jgi:hypothetical protein
MREGGVVGSTHLVGGNVLVAAEADQGDNSRTLPHFAKNKKPWKVTQPKAKKEELKNVFSRTI